MSESTALVKHEPGEMNGQSKALVPATDFGTLIPTEQELAVYQTMAKTAANTPYYGKLGGEAGIVSIMLYARELGIPPMTAISGGLHNIQGRIEMSARMMNSKIRQAGHQLRILEHTDKICRIWGKRKDNGEDWETQFKLEEAARAGLIKKDSNWEKWPKDMLFARAMSRLAKELFADVIGTAYIEGETRDLDDYIDVTPSPSGRGRRKKQTPLPPQNTSADNPAAPPEKTSTDEGITGKEDDDSKPKDAADSGQTAADTGNPSDDPAKETDKTGAEPERQEAPKPDPAVKAFLGKAMEYLVNRKLAPEKLQRAEEMICKEFDVERSDLIPGDCLVSLQKYCRGPLITELTKEE